jgi:hypothetical protein
VAAWIFAVTDAAEVIPAAGQPLAANAGRLAEALEALGAPLPGAAAGPFRRAVEARDAAAVQAVLDPLVLLVVRINPESRVKVERGAGSAVIQQGGYVPAIVKVVNQSTVTSALRITSPQAGPVYAGMSRLSAERMDRVALRETEVKEADPGRFLDLAMHASPPMTPTLSGLEAEYAIALIYSRLAGKLEATIGFDVGQGSQDLGFRGEAAVLFDARPAVRAMLRVKDHDGSPAMARFVFRDAAGHVFPPQAKRLAPDFYFQEHIYRADGESVLLPPGKLTMEWTRGPEYRTLQREIELPAAGETAIEVKLERWIDTASFGFWSGDHHIHGAGCAHYTSPTEGVTPGDMFRQVRGEGLNVGCVLTWGPCFDYQRRFFSPGVHELSEPLSILKYDIEVSGFGSEALGHVCLLNLKDQAYPGSEGTKTKGWPRWTTPVLRWAREQGGYGGYAHSASGLQIDPGSAARRLLEDLDADGDSILARPEAARGLLPDGFEAIDSDRDATLSGTELIGALDRAASRLPNLAVPDMNGVGAMEVCVSTALGVCDFMSSMDTARIAEWNMWYHILDCGFPLKLSGETDFPCMSGERVGQGRVYVRLGPVEKLDYATWCEGLARGRSYVSDGFAHALGFSVNGVQPGPDAVRLDGPGRVAIEARVAFAPRTPLTVAQGGRVPPGGRQWVGDTVTLHGPRSREVEEGGTRLVEVVVNGRAAASREVPADGRIHDLRFDVDIERTSWVALRHFPQLHTNPVTVSVGGRPLRASRASALWCAETIRQLWRARGRLIPEDERDAAKAAFDEATGIYLRIAEEAPDDRP